jgi:predicted CXXCH cytochrome family protein
MKRRRIKRKATVVVLTLLFAALALLLLACSPRSASNTGANNQSETEQSAEGDIPSVVSIQWSPETDCGVCHGTEAESATDSSCDAYLHATMSCVECHDNTDRLSTMHEGVTTADRIPTRLKQTAVTEETCVECHAADEAHLEATATKALTDVNGTGVNPHNLPVTETDSHAQIICSDCHEMHSSAAKRAEKATKLCQSCHHSGVYECYTCHEHG